MSKQKIINYVDAAAKLAESVLQDDTVSTETARALEDFLEASKEVQFFLDMVEADRLKSN